MKIADKLSIKYIKKYEKEIKPKVIKLIEKRRKLKENLIKTKMKLNQIDEELTTLEKKVEEFKNQFWEEDFKYQESCENCKFDSEM